MHVVVVVVVGPPCFSLTLCDFCGHVEIECVGFLGCVGLFSGVPSINTFSRLEEVSLRAGILQSFWRAWLRAVLFRGKHMLVHVYFWRVFDVVLFR
jgi:hypothetical protein